MYKLRLFLTLGILAYGLGFQQNCVAKEENIEASFSGKNHLISTHANKLKTIICENGERITINSNELPKSSIIRAQKDGPIIYMEDAQGKVYSYEVNLSTSQGTRIEIFRLPLLGTLYNYLMPNYYTLPKDRQGEVVPWSMAYADFPNNQDYQTISLFEMIEKNPIVIRNRDPWLPPWFHYTHLGPKSFIGVDLTAAGKYVAVSGFYQGKKAFAFRPLNYDLAGHNFLFNYRLEGQSLVTWQPNILLKLFSIYLSIPQETFSLPTEDWQIVKLKDSHQPNILMIENGRRLVVSSIENSESMYEVYNILEKRWENREEYTDIIFSCYNIHPRQWPFVAPLAKERTGSGAVLGGKTGVIEFSTQEPLRGTFIEDKTFLSQSVYKVRRTFLDFLFNRTSYYDEQGKKIDFTLV